MEDVRLAVLECKTVYFFKKQTPHHLPHTISEGGGDGEGTWKYRSAEGNTGFLLPYY